jgi:hypothetical protein
MLIIFDLCIQSYLIVLHFLFACHFFWKIIEKYYHSFPCMANNKWDYSLCS